MKKHHQLATIGAYIILLVVTLITIKHFWFNNLFNVSNLLNWDAEHYKYISKNGYQGFRIAFFPLFPLIWRLFSVSDYGIVIINSLCFLISFYILIKEFNIKKAKEIALYLSIPSFIFFYLPYSESVFFLCSTSIIVGLRKNKIHLTYLGLFFATLTRPAFSIFVPALIITELLDKNNNKKLLKITTYTILTLIGIALVSIIQYIDTGEWFKFFAAQKGWGNQLQIPKLPLTSWAGGLTVRLDGFAFLIGVLAGGYLTAIIFNFKHIHNKIIPKEVLFSLAYLGGITLSVLIFRGGSLFSLNRFIFATPFIIVIFNYWINQDFTLKNKQLFLIFGLIFFFWLIFGSYLHISETLKFMLLSLYAILLFIVKSNNIIMQKVSPFLLIVVNFTFQIIFYLRFLNGGWIG